MKRDEQLAACVSLNCKYAVATDALQRAFDAMQLDHIEAIDWQYVYRQLDFARKATCDAQELVGKIRPGLDAGDDDHPDSVFLDV